MYKVFLLILFVTVLLSCKKENVQIIKDSKKQNIVFIMADDHTSRVFSIYGGRLDSPYPTSAQDKILQFRKRPKEMNNVYKHPEYKTVVPDLKTELKRKRAELNEEDGDQFPHIQKAIDAHWNV